MRHLLRLLRLGPLLALSLALSGCFVSWIPLIAPDNASFPFERIVFHVADHPDEIHVLQRDGDHYRMTSADPPGKNALVRLKAVTDDVWVAQAWPPPERETGKDRPFLYALLVVGEDRAEVSAYAVVKPADFVPRAGLEPCERAICVEDLDVYAAYAVARAEAGMAPDIAYRLLERE